MQGWIPIWPQYLQKKVLICTIQYHSAISKKDNTLVQYPKEMALIGQKKFGHLKTWYQG